MLKCHMSFFFYLFPKSRVSKDNWILWKGPSLDKRQCVENSQDKKGCVALSHMSIFTHVDPYTLYHKRPGIHAFIVICIYKVEIAAECKLYLLIFKPSLSPKSKIA